ncbi:MAG: hypothetical protein ABSB19_18360 [Methylomonas sp.]|jgi:hypothetical protein
MNATIPNKKEPIDESKLPIAQVSKEEKQRRTQKLKGTMDKIAQNVKERGYTDEMLDELLKDI